MRAEPAIGQRLGDYRIEALLGEGAMGRVYRGVHETLGRPVAIKALKAAAAADRGQVQRFLAEARAVNLIRHENIVECEGLVEEGDGTTYVVMELLEGWTLGAALEASGTFAPGRAVRIAAQIPRPPHIRSYPSGNHTAASSATLVRGGRGDAELP